MSTTTTKLGLTKPDPTENADVAVLNSNADKIDAAFAGIVGAFKNAIRNGDLGVWQRGPGPFTTNNGYTADAWQMVFTGGTFTVSRNGLNPGSQLAGDKYSIQGVVAGQSAAGDLAAFAIKIEDVRKYAGQQVTLSFRAVAGSGTPKIGVEVGQIFGTGGSPSTTVNTPISAVTLSTSGANYSVTFTMPSISGKTLGTNEDSYIVINLWLSAGSTNATRASSIGIQNATFNIWNLQLEAGSVATGFEQLPQQVQLAWCQRYLQVLTVVVFNTSTNIFHKQTFRANPAITGGGAGFTVNQAGTDVTYCTQTSTASATLIMTAEL